MNYTYFTSKKNYLKRDVSGSASIAAPNVATAWGSFQSSYTVNHNLGYIPQIRVYYEESATDNKVYPAGGNQINGVYPGLPLGSIFCVWELSTTNLVIYLEANAALAGNRTIYWVIYLDN